MSQRIARQIAAAIGAVLIAAASLSAQPCPIVGYDSVLGTFAAANSTGSGTVVYFDVRDCKPPTSSGYPYSLHSVNFSLVDVPGAQWPVTVDVVMYDRQPNGHACYGPGTELCRQTVVCERANFEYPAIGTVYFPGECCLNGPAYAGLEFTDQTQGMLPAVAVDDQAAAMCAAWQFDVASGEWKEWTHYWPDPLPGYPMIGVEVTPVDTATCGGTCFLTGDVDGSGFFSIADAVSAINCWYSSGYCPQWHALDLNADCIVTFAEVQQILCTFQVCVPPWEPWQPYHQCTCAEPYRENGCGCMPGDADDSKAINISDAVYLINYVFAGGPAPQPYPLCSGDPDGSCLVSISDAVFLISYIFTFTEAPPNCLEWSAGCGTPR